MAKKSKRHIFPEIPEALPVEVVDNHTHIAVKGDPNSADGSGEDGRPLSGGEQVRRMELAGVRHAISSGCEVGTLRPTLELAAAFPGQISAALAIHPNDAALHAGVVESSPDGIDHQPSEEQRRYSLEDAVGLVAELAADEHCVAIGETGLDYFRTAQAGEEAQKRAFRMHIALAKEMGLPMQIHDREAHRDVIDILLADGAPEKTVFHCYSGDAEMADVLAENGWYASFAGNVTYPANEDFRAAFLRLPPELILAETDAPYLTAQPWRGHPNAPYAVAYTVRFMADLRGADLAEWCQQISDNSRAVYGV